MDLTYDQTMMSAKNTYQQDTFTMKVISVTAKNIIKKKSFNSRNTESSI